MRPGGLEQGTGFAPPQHEPSTPSQGSRHSQHGSGQGCGRTTGCAPTFPPGFAQQSQGNTMFQQQMQQRPPIVEQQAFLQQNGQNGQSFQQQTAQMPGQGPVWYGAGWMPRGPNVGMAPSFAGCGPRGPCPSSCPNPNFAGGPMPSGQAPSGMGCGSQLGGMNPSMSNLQNVLGLIGSWSDEELLALQSHLSDLFVTVQQRRMIPERFGARLDGSSTVDPFVVRFQFQDSQVLLVAAKLDLTRTSLQRVRSGWPQHQFHLRRNGVHVRKRSTSGETTWMSSRLGQLRHHWSFRLRSNMRLVGHVRSLGTRCQWLSKLDLGGFWPLWERHLSITQDVRHLLECFVKVCLWPQSVASWALVHSLQTVSSLLDSWLLSFRFAVVQKLCHLELVW